MRAEHNCTTCALAAWRDAKHGRCMAPVEDREPPFPAWMRNVRNGPQLTRAQPYTYCTAWEEAGEAAA